MCGWKAYRQAHPWRARVNVRMCVCVSGESEPRRVVKEMRLWCVGIVCEGRSRSVGCLLRFCPENVCLRLGGRPARGRGEGAPEAGTAGSWTDVSRMQSDGAESSGWRVAALCFGMFSYVPMEVFFLLGGGSLTASLSPSFLSRPASNSYVQRCRSRGKVASVSSLRGDLGFCRFMFCIIVALHRFF